MEKITISINNDKEIKEEDEINNCQNQMRI